MTLTNYEKARKRRALLSMGAVLAVVVAGAVGILGRDTTAKAGEDEHQLNISSNACVSGGASFHFVAPHTEDGDGGVLTVSYTLDGGATQITTASESRSNGSSKAQWDVNLTGSGTFTITGATSSGGDVLAGGLDEATITCQPESVTGTLTVIKIVDNNDNPNFTATPGGFQIHVMSGGSDVSGSPAAGTSSGTTYTLDAGAYTVSESGGPSGYSVSFSGDCNSDGSVSVTPGSARTCTITNAAPAPQTVTGSITIHKVWEGSPAGSADFSGDLGSFTLDGSTTSKTFSGLDAGTYAVTEAGVAGWSLTGMGCSLPASSTGHTLDITLAEGQNLDCTFTNTANAESGTATVTVIKYVDGAPATSGSFDFSSMTTASNISGCESGCTNAFTLDSTNGFSATTSAMALGSSYFVSETNINSTCGPNDQYMLAGFTTGSSLAAAQGGTQSPAAPSFSDLQGNQYVIVWNTTCAPPNVAGTITVVKAWLDQTGNTITSGMPSSVSFTGAGSGVSSPFNLDSAGSWQMAFSGLAAGSFSLTETPVSGWTLVGASCTGGSSSSSSLSGSTLSVSLAAGENLTCTFTNQLASTTVVTGSITIVKNWVDQNGAALTTGMPSSVSFSGAGATIPSTFVLGTNGVWNTSFTGLAAGNFSFSETPVGGWGLLSFTCQESSGSPILTTNNSGVYGLSLAAGQNAICTFTNQFVPATPPIVAVPPAVVTSPSNNVPPASSQPGTNAAPTTSQAPSTYQAPTSIVGAVTAPNTGSGSSSDTGSNLVSILGIAAVVSGAAALAFGRKHHM